MPESDARSVTESDARSVTESDARSVTESDARSVTESDVRSVTESDARSVYREKILYSTHERGAARERHKYCGLRIGESEFEGPMQLTTGIQGEWHHAVAGLWRHST